MSKNYPPELVEVEYIELFEVRDAVDLRRGVAKTLTTGLPAFVIKEAALGNHQETVEQVTATIEALTGRPFNGNAHASKMVPQNIAVNVGQGVFHEDYNPAIMPSGTFVVHRTNKGIGMATFANSGSEYRGGKQEQSEVKGDLITSNLVDGMIDPRIIDKVLHYTLLGEGDTTVFPVDTDRGPIWHRFDTLYGPREAESNFVKPAQAAA